MKKTVLLFTLVLSIAADSFAQLSFSYIDSIEVVKNGNTLVNPWIGGFNAPQFSEIDLNKDGTKDLFVFDRVNNTIKTFINKGTVGTPDYVYAPIYQQYFPQDLESFALLADFNGDGKEDIFTYKVGSMIVYKNVSTLNIPQFEPYFTDFLPATIFGGASNVYTYSDDLPGLVDVDGDGDMDVLSFHLGGLSVDYFENVATPGSDTIILERSTDCWGQFHEHPQNDSIVISGCKRSRSNPRHTGSTITLMHLDNNGLLDIILGDVDSPNLTALYNTGSSSAASMSIVEYDFPQANVSADMRDFLGTFLIDVDNDGDKDLLAAPSDRFKCQDTANVMWYKNNGSDSDADLQIVQRDFIAGDMIDHGTASHPTFTDIDGDGLLDIIVGNEGYNSGYNNSTFQPIYVTQFAFYHNIGTAAEPRFEFITDDFAGMSSLNLKGAYPTFGDIDGDGDMDLLIGTNEGWIVHMENMSGPSMSPTYQIADDKFFFLKGLASATPQLYDFDGDNLLDLAVGEKDGYMKLYMNTGTATSPSFSNSTFQDTLGQVHLFKPGYNSYISPFFAKVNNTTHLFAGNNFGDVIMYNNIDGNLNGAFTPIDTFHVSGGYISPCLANINSTDSLEMILGEMTGGITLYGIGEYQLVPDSSLIDTNDTTSVTNIPPLEDNINIFPNPSEGFFNIGMKDLNGQQLEIHVFDITGRVIFRDQLTPTGSSDIYQLDISAAEKGTYLLSFSNGTDYTVQKIIKY